MAAAVALETLKIYESDRIVDHVRDVSRRFIERLKGIGRHPLVGLLRQSVFGRLAGYEDVNDAEPAT